jgi:hypothetical protein
MCWRIAIPIVFLLVCAGHARAQHPVCGKPPDWDIKTQDTDKLKGDLEGRAQLLTKYAGGVGLSGQIQTERETLYKNTDATEARRQDAYLAYMFCVIVMDDKTLSTQDRIKAIEIFKRPVTSTSTIPPSPKPGQVSPPSVMGVTPYAATCTVGQAVELTATTFHITFVAVEDGPQLRALMRQGNGELRATSVVEAMKADAVRPLSAPGTLTVHILGAGGSQIPSSVPYLTGEGVCRGMTSIRTRGGILTTSVPIGERPYPGRTTLVLPRNLLTSTRARFCVETSFRTAFLTPPDDGPFRGRRNVRCTAEGSGGNTKLAEAIARGLSSNAWVFVQRK